MSKEINVSLADYVNLVELAKTFKQITKDTVQYAETVTKNALATAEEKAKQVKRLQYHKPILEKIQAALKAAGLE